MRDHRVADGAHGLFSRPFTERSPRFECVRDLADPGDERAFVGAGLFAPRTDPRHGRRRPESFAESLARSRRASRRDGPDPAPSEVGDGDAARIREDVGQDQDPALREDPVGLERRRAVRALGDHPSPNAGRVLRGDLILARCKDENVALELEQLLVGETHACVAVLERSVLAHVFREQRYVETVDRVEAARHVRDRQDRGAARVQLLSGDTADVAEALNDAPLLIERPGQPVTRG